MTPPEIVTLKNGVTVGEPIVTTTYVTLTDLFKSGLSGALAVYELNKAARIEGGKVTNQQALKKLVNLGLAYEDGSIHDDVRQVVVNSLDGDGLKMHLVAPLQSES